MAVELRPRIVVIGVGGAGGNAVNNMIEAKLQGVEFVVANTDAQALTRSKAPTQIQLGIGKTAGLGAGANPDVGMEAAKESSDEIKKILHGAHMCFIAAGMGGGTGTGAAPIIARIAKEQKVLTVGVVTKPFDFEGKRRMQVAEKGISDLRTEVDTLLIIPNQNLFRIANNKTTFAEAFSMADKVLYSGVRGITDLMVMPGLINLDFADVRTVMAGMGSAMMGEGEAEGENRALKAAQAAIANPLLDDVSMRGAKGVLINITGGYDMTLFEVDEAANEVRREVDVDAHIILGSTFDENLNGKIRVSVVAAGLQQLQAARPPQPVRELQAGLTSAVMNAPSPAAELGIVAQPSPVAPQPAQQVVPPSELRPAPPIIRTRPAAPPAEPEIAEEPVMEEEAVVEAEAEPAPQPPAPAPAEPAKDRSFASLFGWKSKPAEEPAQPVAKPAPAEDSFEDDLEIPAFLRRSGNA
ncbi:MAG: cell division protein FtsZ [Hyphomonadaceae bacterium]